MLTKETECSLQDLSLLDVPRVITAIDTGYEYFNSVASLNNTEVWMCGSNIIVKLFNLEGELKNQSLQNQGIWRNTLR